MGEEQILMVEIGAGELIDKLTILEIKLAKIKDENKLANIRYELNSLKQVRSRLNHISRLNALEARLKQVNQSLWVIEDEIRFLEDKQDFGEKFIELARSVYKTNDERAHIKKEINLAAGAKIIEEKSYRNID